MTRAQFRTDLQDMLSKLDAAARSGYLPAYLPAGADLDRMARTVRMLAEVRRPPATDMADKAPAKEDHEPEWQWERKRLYALPAEQGERSDIAQQWEDVAAENSQVVVLADPGMGKSWLIRAETHRLAVAASGFLADPSVQIEDALIPVPVRADVLATAPGRDLANAASCYLAAEGLLARRSVAEMQNLVNGGGVVLMVDALDEVPRRAQGTGGPTPEKRLQDLFRQWAARCDRSVRCIFTSRLAGYSGPPLPGAREVELLPFTPQDARTALRAWNLPSQAAE